MEEEDCVVIHLSNMRNEIDMENLIIRWGNGFYQCLQFDARAVNYADDDLSMAGWCTANRPHLHIHICGGGGKLMCNNSPGVCKIARHWNIDRWSAVSRRKSIDGLELPTWLSPDCPSNRHDAMVDDKKRSRRR